MCGNLLQSITKNFAGRTMTLKQGLKLFVGVKPSLKRHKNPSSEDVRPFQ